MSIEEKVYFLEKKVEFLIEKLCELTLETRIRNSADSERESIQEQVQKEFFSVATLEEELK